MSKFQERLGKMKKQREEAAKKNADNKKINQVSKKKTETKGGTPKMKNPPKPPVKKTVKKQAAKKKVGGHNKKMTLVLFKKICKEIETTHEGLMTICKRSNTSSPAFYDLMDKDTKNNLPDLYARAKKRQAEYLVDLSRETVFNRSNDEKPFVGANHIQRDKLIHDSIKWQSAKLDPKKYGDRVDVNHSGNIDIDFSD